MIHCFKGGAKFGRDSQYQVREPIVLLICSDGRSGDFLAEIKVKLCFNGAGFATPPSHDFENSSRCGLDNRGFVDPGVRRSIGKTQIRSKFASVSNYGVCVVKTSLLRRCISPAFKRSIQ